MNLWIVYILGIFSLLRQGTSYDDPTARVLDVAAPWKPLQTIHTAVGPHYIAIGTLNPSNSLHLAQIAQHNAQIMHQVKAFNPPVTQYRNPFPVFEPAAQSHFHPHQWIIPKENTHHIHTSASNIAQTILPNNYLKPAYITGKPAFNLKPEYITKPEFYNGIPTTAAKNPHIPSFKQMPNKDAFGTLFHGSPSYKDLILTPPPPQYYSQSYKSQQANRDKPVGSFSFPGDGVGSLTFYGPASHLIRGNKPSPPKPQPTVFFPSEIGNTIRNGQQFYQTGRPNIPKQVTSAQSLPSIQPVRYESSTPSFFGTTSVKISPSHSFELTFSRAPNANEFIPPSTSSSLSATSAPISPVQNVEQFKSQSLPTIPASVLTPFFQQIQQQRNPQLSTVQSLNKEKFVKDEYSNNLVPPPYIHLESSTFRTTPNAPTKRPISLQEQANALNILNKYNIPVISPLQDANKFKYEGNIRKPPIIPLNYTVSSVIAFPTNAPEQTPLTIQPTGILSTENIFGKNKNQFENFPKDHPPIPQKTTFNPEHSFFTIKDAITVKPAHQIAVSATPPSIKFQTQIEVQTTPEFNRNEDHSILTTNPPRMIMQLGEYHTTTTSSPAPPLSSPTTTPFLTDMVPTRNRSRGKTRRRRPRPTTSRDPEQDSRDNINGSEHGSVISHETIPSTERTLQRIRPGSRTRTQPKSSSSTLPPADPTLRIIQRNSLRVRFNSPTPQMNNKQTIDTLTTIPVENQSASLKTTPPSLEEVDTPEQEIFPSTTALSNEHEDKLFTQLQESTNTILFSSEPTTVQETKPISVIPEPTQPFALETSPALPPTTPRVELQAVDQMSSSQTPHQEPVEPTKAAENGGITVNQRTKYRHKQATTPKTPTEQQSAINKSLINIDPSSSVSSLNDNSVKTVTKLRPVNKYRPEGRPRFSVKDYRQRISTHSTTSTTTQVPASLSTTSAQRSRLRFPTRKRLLPSLRLRMSTTDKPEDNHVEDEKNGTNDQELDSNVETPNLSSTSTTSRPTSSRRGTNTRRGSNNRFRISSTSTEQPASVEEADKKGPVRQWSRERYTHRSRVPSLSTEILPELQQINMNPEDLNNIAVETVSPSSTAESKPESAIMKINKADHVVRQSAEVYEDDNHMATSDENGDLNQSPSEQSERVAQLTLSGSTYKFNNPGGSNLSRRIPSYFTLATEDPILPIEAFFPNVKPKSNRTT